MRRYPGLGDGIEPVVGRVAIHPGDELTNLLRRVEADKLALLPDESASEQSAVWVAGYAFSDLECPNYGFAHPPSFASSRGRLALVEDALYGWCSEVSSDGSAGDALHYWWRGAIPTLHYSSCPRGGQVHSA